MQRHKTHLPIIQLLMRQQTEMVGLCSTPVVAFQALELFTAALQCHKTYTTKQAALVANTCTCAPCCVS
jgi:hypothetical protein